MSNPLSIISSVGSMAGGKGGADAPADTPVSNPGVGFQLFDSAESWAGSVEGGNSAVIDALSDTQTALEADPLGAWDQGNSLADVQQQQDTAFGSVADGQGGMGESANTNARIYDTPGGGTGETGDSSALLNQNGSGYNNDAFTEGPPDPGEAVEGRRPNAFEIQMKGYNASPEGQAGMLAAADPNLIGPDPSEVSALEQAANPAKPSIPGGGTGQNNRVAARVSTTPAFGAPPNTYGQRFMQGLGGGQQGGMGAHLAKGVLSAMAAGMKPDPGQTELAIDAAKRRGRSNQGQLNRTTAGQLSDQQINPATGLPYPGALASVAGVPRVGPVAPRPAVPQIPRFA